MKTLSHEQLDWLVDVLRYWGTLIPSVKTLIVMIGLDIASGWLVAIAKHTLNSTTSFAGMCKKAMILLLVAVGTIIEPYTADIPLSSLIAIGFIGMEGLSILENAGALGIPLPSVLVDVLEKLQTSKKTKLEQKTGNTGALERNTAAALDNTAAIKIRTEQVEEAKNIPQTVVLAEPVQAQIVNTPESPAIVHNVK